MLFQLDHVSKDYRGFRALDDLVCEVHPGAMGLLGPNGAGKSTLIKLLLGLVKLTAGHATIMGQDVRRAKHVVRESVGYMPEDDCLIPGLKGVETVAYAGEMGGLPRKVALRRAHEMLDYVGLAEERYREVQTYSTGMKQKIKLALALVHSPQLLFLDEPTSGPDPKGRDKMLRLIKDLQQNRNVSVIVSTHILTDIEQTCETVMILGNGRLLVHDQLAYLRKSTGEYKVRFDEAEEAGAFANSLDAAGLNVERLEPDLIMLRECGDHAPEELFRLAAEKKVAIRALESSRTSLEDIFLQAVEAQNAGAAGGARGDGGNWAEAPRARDIPDQFAEPEVT